MRVKILLIYSGSLPNYFSVFLRSCQWNPNVEWTLLLDRTLDMPLPPNVSVREFSVDDLVRRVRDRLAVTASFSDAYKLCDFRPALGVLYPELVEGFDVWGHCDPDVVFGDLGRLLPATPERMPPKLQMRGALSFYRNDDVGNNLFRLPHPTINFRDAMAAPKYMLFDEWNGLWRLIRTNNVNYILREDEVAEINVDRYDLRLHFSRENHYPQVFVWDHGRLFRHYRDGAVLSRDEFAYIHLQKRSFAPPGVLPDRFAFVPGVMVPLGESDDLGAVLCMNRPRHFKSLAMQFRRLGRRWRARSKIDRRYMRVTSP